MISFTQLKNLPKIDLHINFLTSISEKLIYELNCEKDISSIISMKTLPRFNDYNDCLSLPIKLLNNDKNIQLALKELLNRLANNGIIYGEIFLDLPLYNSNLSLDYLVKLFLKIIIEEGLNFSLVLCTCDKFTKEDNLNVLEIYKQHKNEGIAGVYFQKNKNTNMSDFIYLFDRMIKDDIPYIISYDTKITNQIKEIYAHANRIEYNFPIIDDEILTIVRDNNIMLSFAITKFIEFSSNKELYGFIADLVANNFLISFVSEDMTILNTDIINEYCLLFNNVDLKLLELVKILINNISYLRINDRLKEKLILVLKEKSNNVL